MAGNLKKEMNSYSNERIQNIIKQQNFFGIESVEMAKSIAKERGILSEEQMVQIERDVRQSVAARKATPYTPKTVEASLSYGTAFFLLFILVRWAYKLVFLSNHI